MYSSISSSSELHRSPESNAERQAGGKKCRASSPVEDHGNGLKIGRVLEIKLEVGSTFNVGEPDNRGTGDAVSQHHTGSTSRLADGLAASVGAGNKAAFGGSHGNHVFTAIEQDGTGHADGQLHVAHHHLAALAQHGIVVEASERESVHGPAGGELHGPAPHQCGSLRIAELRLEGIRGQFALTHRTSDVLVRVVGQRLSQCERLLVLLLYLGPGRQLLLLLLHRGGGRDGGFAGTPADPALVTGHNVVPVFVPVPIPALALADEVLDVVYAEEADEVDEGGKLHEEGQDLAQAEQVQRGGDADLLPPPAHEVVGGGEEEHHEDLVGEADGQRQRIGRQGPAAGLPETAFTEVLVLRGQVLMLPSAMVHR